MKPTIIIFLVVIILIVIKLISSPKNKSTKTDKVANEASVTYSSIGSENVNFEIMELIKEGQKIKAIKKYRELTGASLKEANDYIENLVKNQANM